MFGIFGENTEMTTVEFGETEIYHILYNIEKGGRNHEYSNWEQVNGENLQGAGARVDVNININPDNYPEFDEDTIKEAEMMIAACLDKELDLMPAEQRHGDNSCPFK